MYITVNWKILTHVYIQVNLAGGHDYDIACSLRKFIYQKLIQDLPFYVAVSSQKG